MTANKIIKQGLFVFALINIFSFLSLPQSVMFYSAKFILFLLLSFLLVFFKLNSKEKLHIRIPNTKMFIAIYIWTLLLIPSLNGSNGITGSLLAAFSYLLLGFFAFVAMPDMFYTEKDYFEFNRVLLLAICVGLVFAITLSFTGTTQQFYLSADGRLRYTFSFVNSNFLGIFCYIASLICLKLILMQKLKKRNLLLVFITLVSNVYIITLADSRTPIYSLIVWIVVYSFLKIRKKYRNLIILSSLLGISIVTLTPFFNFNLKILDRLLSYRISNWIRLVSSLNGSEWIFGKGISLDASEIIRGATYDNSYISTLIQSGLLGLLGMIFFIFTVIISISKIKNRSYKKIAFASIISWLVYCVLESAFFSTGNLASIYVWVDLGILIAMDQKRKAQLK